MNTAYELFNLISQAVPGVTLAQLQALQPNIARRTAQRWIGQLIDDGIIVGLGAGRARRYYVTTGLTGSHFGLCQERAPYLVSPVVSPSLDCSDILAYLSQPFSTRPPVGYRQDFLEQYQPNQSYYLPASVRHQLHQIGQTSQANAPAGTHGRAMLGRLLIDLSWASSNLEGNTYSWLDTRELIQSGTAAQGKAVMETQMILNHKSAIEMMLENIDTLCFDRFTLCNLHAMLSENLLPEKRDEGRLRQHAVGIGHSAYRPLALPQTLEAMFDLMLAKANQILDPFEQSFFIMVHLPYLQPFADVNKRTSRLAANLPLLRANLCPLTFLDVPEQSYVEALFGVYEMTRIELMRDLYVAAYQRSTREYITIQQNMAKPDPVRLTWRDLIKTTVRNIVLQQPRDALGVILQAVAEQVPPSDRANVQALIVDELRQLHEGVLVRYGLRPSEFACWKKAGASTNSPEV